MRFLDDAPNPQRVVRVRPEIEGELEKLIASLGGIKTVPAHAEASVLTEIDSAPSRPACSHRLSALETASPFNEICTRPSPAEAIPAQHQKPRGESF